MARKVKSDWAKIERSREIRLWTTQVAAPIITLAAAAALSNERIRDKISMKIAKAHVKGKNLIKRFKK